jgi:hypothetical protein
VQALIQGAQESGVSTEFFRMIDELPDQQICHKIQGLNLSSEQVLAALDIQQGCGPVFELKVEWLKQKIATADEAWLKKFVQAVTGQPVLGPGARLHIRQTNGPSEAFAFEACFNNLFFPQIEMNRDDFLLALEASIRDQGFNRA